MATMAIALDRNLFLAYYSFLSWLVPNLTRAYGNNGHRPRQKFAFGILQLSVLVGSQFDEGLWQQWPSPSTEICFWHITAFCLGWFPNLTRAYGNNGHRPRQKFVFRILQLSVLVGSQFDEGLWQQWPSPSTEICFWHITAFCLGWFPIWRGPMATMAFALDRNLF